MKTAIQQSIDKIKYFQDSTKNFDEKCAFAIAMDVLEDHKKTEKEYLENAIRHGWKAAINHKTANDGNMLLCAVNFKEKLVEHLKTTHISDVHDLWGQTKSYYRNKLIEMGGSYASWGDKISVKIIVDGNRYSFDVFLSELT